MKDQIARLRLCWSSFSIAGSWSISGDVAIVPDLAGSLIDYAALLKKTGRKKQASNLETRARNILSANPDDRLARLTIDVRELERPNSFLPAR